VPRDSANEEVDRRARLENVWLRRPIIVILVIIFLSALALSPGRQVRFDYNLLHMQSAGLPAVIFQDKLIQSSTKSVLFGAVVADSLTQATNLAAAITNLSAVESVETMAGYLTEDQTGKLALLGKIKQVASEIQFSPVDTRPVDVPELTQTLWSLHGYCGLAVDEVKDDPALREQLTVLRQAISALLRRLLLDDRRAVGKKLAEFQQALFNDVRETFLAIQHQDDRERLKALGYLE
jgi:hypothetical protein